MGGKKGKSKGKGKKIPRWKEEPSPQKEPTLTSFDSESCCPSWRVASMDRDGPFGWNSVSCKTFLSDIWPKLRGYEAMTWKQIHAAPKKNHSTKVSSLSKKARDRLAEIEQDDLTTLFRFRLTGKQRLWGIKRDIYFDILWWDPKHEVCPSKKKHT